jgi:hypothetical protein
MKHPHALQLSATVVALCAGCSLRDHPSIRVADGYFEAVVPAAKQGAGLDWTLVPPGFLDAVNRYEAATTRMAGARDALGETAASLELLAMALEQLPGPHGALLGTDAGRTVRRHAAALGGLEQPAAQRRAIKEALLVVAGTLATAAAGPYGGDPLVAERVREFTAAVEQIPPSAVPTDRAFTNEALMKAARALRAFELALAAGRLQAR